MQKSFKQLKVWQKSVTLVTQIYKDTDNLPKKEIYSLTSQIRRSAISIPSNIAEGYKRKNIGEYLHFLHIAESSAAELETQLIIMNNIYPELNIKESQVILEEVQKMLFVLIKKLDKDATL